MNVTAIIVTRGDVDLTEILNSLPSEWEVLVWDNGARVVHGRPGSATIWMTADLSVYGRYAAIEYATGELIYVQDDDVIVSDPQAITNAWMEHENYYWGEPGFAASQHVVCNMPLEFRHDFYSGHALVGFGAAFHRDVPARAFDRFLNAYVPSDAPTALFNRTCDIVFTALTPRVLVDVPKTDLPWASGPNRMWMQPTHQAERGRMLDLCKEVLNART